MKKIPAPITTLTPVRDKQMLSKKFKLTDAEKPSVLPKWGTAVFL